MRQPHMTQYSILELGTGCGLVGLVLASMSKNCRLILTDLDEDSLRLATRNAQKSREVFDSVWECSTLEWSEPHKFRADENLALVVASDCIYNSDSIPDLVRTIAHLVRRTREPPKASLGPRVLVSTKRRHSSEDMFFDLMSKAGFKQQEHATIPMYDRYRESTGQAFEQVDIYIFE